MEILMIVYVFMLEHKNAIVQAMFRLPSTLILDAEWIINPWFTKIVDVHERVYYDFLT